MSDFIAIPQKHSDMLADAWRADDRQLAERFRQAMRRARSELGPGGKFGAVLKRAWALDPDLRERFGDAISMGLRGMWASDVLRAEQSERIKQTYTQDLRKQRSETLKRNWADAGFREKMMRSSARLVNLGGDKFDVILGCKLNEAPLSLADASRLARRATGSTISVIGSLVNGTVVHHGARLPLGDDCDLRRRREMS